MRHAMHSDDADQGALFDSDRGCTVFSQRLLTLAGDRPSTPSDEVLYVLSGSATASIAGSSHSLGPDTALFVARDTPWSVAGAALAVSVLVHDPAPASRSHACIDLTAAGRGAATGGRAFLLGATPEVGCSSVTQFIGLVPPGRAPDHFHTYDEVIYILEGSGTLFVGDEREELRAGTCVHLPARLVHCLANDGDTVLRLLGVFRPAGSPAEAYYPDGTLAVVPSEGN